MNHQQPNSCQASVFFEGSPIETSLRALLSNWAWSWWHPGLQILTSICENLGKNWEQIYTNLLSWGAPTCIGRIPGKSNLISPFFIVWWHEAYEVCGIRASPSTAKNATGWFLRGLEGRITIALKITPITSHLLEYRNFELWVVGTCRNYGFLAFHFSLVKEVLACPETRRSSGLSKYDIFRRIVADVQAMARRNGCLSGTLLEHHGFHFPMQQDIVLNTKPRNPFEDRACSTWNTDDTWSAS